MIAVRVDLEKLGDALDRTSLATIQIANDGTGDGIEGNYQFNIRTQDGKEWTGHVYDHCRLDGVLPLLLRVLERALK